MLDIPFDLLYNRFMKKLMSPLVLVLLLSSCKETQAPKNLNQRDYDIEVGIKGFTNAENEIQYHTKYGTFWCFEREDTIEIRSSQFDIEGFATDFLEIPDTINNKPVTIIGKEAFSGVKIKTLKLPKYLEIIDYYAFHGCFIKEIMFNETLKEIGKEAFVSCDVVNLVIPDSVLTIKERAFSANSIEHCIIGKNIKEINNNLFTYGRLKDVVLPEGLESIGEYAFWANNLEKITIPDSVHKINIEAFSENPLTEIIIGDDVEIHESAFNGSYPELNDESFVDYYTKNNKKGGKYILKEKRLDYMYYYWEYVETK
jgi:hypothetical protein